MGWSDLVWVLVAGAVIVALLSDAEARPNRANTCPDWANTVEKLERLDGDTLAAVVNEMHKLRGHPRYPTLMKAVMWHKAGQSSDAAWRQCENY